MINNHMIIVKQDLDSISYDTGIEIEIVSENFDYPDRFTKITSSQLDSIMLDDSSINKENLLMAFLYINSYIGCRSNNTNHPERNPRAFFKSIKNMSEDLSMSINTINQCINCLTTGSNPLLIKKEVGSVIINNKPQNIPNIYVLNELGYEQEIKWALIKMLEVYGIDNFKSIKNNESHF